MPSPKKSVTSKASTYSCPPVRNSVKRKVSSTQTYNSLSVEELFKANLNPKEDFNFDEETRTGYYLALNYINNVHRFMNKKLCENYGDCGDTNSEAKSIFKMPDVPNFATVFHMLLEKSKPTNVPVTRQPKEDSDTKIRCGIKSNISEFVPDIQKLTELKTLQDIEESTPKKIVIESQKSKGVVKSSKTTTQSIDLVDSAKDFHVPRESCSVNYIRKLEMRTYNESIIEEEPMIEEIITEEVESDSPIETHRSLPNDLPEEGQEYNEDYENDLPDKVNFDQESIADLIKKRVQEEFSSYMNKSNDKQMRLVSSSHHVVNIQPQINLIEYAQKKLERKNFEANTPPNYGNVETAPKKVTNMFQRISQENLQHISRFEILSSEGQNSFNRTDNESDSDSVILDDEEFERTHRGYYREEEYDQDRGSPQEISHPLKLTGKDMPKLNEKMLNTIGLFTERGDIRPGILDKMEQNKKAKALDSRNKQFRVKRQWDLQMHMTPKKVVIPNLPSVSSERSFISMSSDIRFDLETTKKV